MGTRARVLVLAATLLVTAAASVSSIGITMSYFLPRDGRFSHPVSPLSVRDVGVSLGRYFGLAGSLSLYGIAAMGITDAEGTPLELGGPGVGSFKSILGSLVGKIIIPIKVRQVVKLELVGRGGVFGCYNIAPPLMTGAVERYLAETAPGGPYEAVEASITSEGRWGWGWLFGGSATYYISSQVGVSLGALYYLGGAPLKLSGSFDAYNTGGQAADDASLPSVLQGARLDYSGLELLVGVSFQL
jgi:hypothetical protein